MEPSMHVPFISKAYLRLCFIQVIVLAPPSVCSSKWNACTLPSIYVCHISIFSFTYLCVPCCFHACLSVLLCVREWRRYTIYFMMKDRWWTSRRSVPLCTHRLRRPGTSNHSKVLSILAGTLWWFFGDLLRANVEQVLNVNSFSY